MDTQPHNLVQIDGEWVDVYQIMAQARNSDPAERETTPEPVAYTPEVGILSRTIFPSPLFKHICPANIRHKDLTDVVFVGEDSIQLKQIHDYGRLRHVATKADFAGKILAARVFGDPREVTKTASSPPTRRPTLHRPRRSLTGDGEVLPPEVLVLTLTSRTLMFLWAQHNRNGAVAFAQKTLKLPFGRSRLDRFGSYLAIDHKHRAMAVAATEGSFILYKTKNMEEWRQELQRGLQTTPISDERIISIEGRIQHMEFLSSGTGLDSHHVVLLFVVTIQGRTRLTCFDWDSREDLSKAAARTERVLVDSDDNNPSLLIPLARTSDFLLVLDNHISAYKDVLSGTPTRAVGPIHEGSLPSLLPGDSKHSPCWVAWDKTLRNPGYPKEAFYVAREDGRLIYVQRAASGEVDIGDAGSWPYRIDTAFACLSVDNSEFSMSYPDVLVAGGNGNDGLVCKLGSWPTEYSYTASYQANQLSYIESIPNWTPLADMDVSILPVTRASSELDRYSILVANSASPHGGVSELRYGVQSLIDDSFGGMTGCTGLWVVDYGSHTVAIDGKAARQHWVTFVITIPPETLEIQVVRTQSESRGDFSGAWEDGSWDKCQLPNEDDPVGDGVIRDEETLTACPWSERFSIQVTASKARILSRPRLQLNHSIDFDCKVLLAASQPGFPAVVVAYREAGSIYLEVLRISNSDGTFIPIAEESRLRYQLDHDPTCITLFEVDGIQCIFISTFGHRIGIFALNGNGLALLYDHTAIINDMNVNIESAVVLTAQGRQTLVCATRNGLVIHSPLRLHNQTPVNLEWSVIRLGVETAQIRASSADPSTAFVSCGQDFCRVRSVYGNVETLETDSIWFTNRMNPAYLQAQVTAMYQLPFMTDMQNMERNLGGFLFAVSGDQLLFSQLDSDRRAQDDYSFNASYNDCRTIPRTLFTGAKPTNILYLTAFRKLVVSTMEAKEQRAPPNGYRVLESAIKLLNVYDEKPLDEPDVKQELEEPLTNRLVSGEIKLKHGERVYSLTEWNFEDHRNKKYNLIIACTGFMTDSGTEKGRRLIISPGKTGTKLIVQKAFDYDDGPVYCAATFGNDGIITVIGKTLYFERYDSEAGKMIKRATQDLPSPGTSVSVDSGYVQVSTLQHSHLCYDLTQNGEGVYIFLPVLTDSRERSCADHLVVDVVAPPQAAEALFDKIILATDKRSATVTGLYHAIDRMQKNAADTVFEACLPHTVVRLQQGNIRPPWRRPSSSVSTRCILADDIVGACSDGTIYNFTITNEPTRHLLRYLQNLIEEKAKRDPSKQHTVLHRRNGAIHDVLMNGTDGAQDDLVRAHPLDPTNHDRSLAGPRHKHIDGDVLLRWMHEDGDLKRLIREDADADVGALLISFTKALWEDFVGGQEQAVSKTETLLQEILMPIL